MIKSFKLFESKEDDVSHYLGILGTSVKEVEEIFDDILIMGEEFSINFKMKYKNPAGHNVNKWTQKRIPTLIIQLKCKSQYDTPEFLSGLNQAIGYFYNMYNDIKITYGFSDSNFNIKCQFPMEVDNDIPSLEDIKKILSEAIKQACDELLKSKPDNLDVSHTRTYIELNHKNGVPSKWTINYSQKFWEIFEDKLKKIGLSISKTRYDYEIKLGDKTLFLFDKSFLNIGRGRSVENEFRHFRVRCEYELSTKKG
jgi:hypothetical protein